MAEYRSKTYTVQAIQFTGDNYSSVQSWLKCYGMEASKTKWEPFSNGAVSFESADRHITMKPRDWVFAVEGTDGKPILSVYRDSEFRKHFEVVPSAKPSDDPPMPSWVVVEARIRRPSKYRKDTCNIEYVELELDAKALRRCINGGA